MSEPGRSPQDKALQQAIRQLETADGPPAALDQRIRARAHAAVRRRRGLPLWLSAVASVFLVFFAASLWRYQGGEPPLPAALNEMPASAIDRSEEGDAASGEAESGKTDVSAQAARLNQTHESVDGGSSSPTFTDDVARQAPTASSTAPVERRQIVDSAREGRSSSARADAIAPAAPVPPAEPEPSPAGDAAVPVLGPPRPLATPAADRDAFGDSEAKARARTMSDSTLPMSSSAGGGRASVGRSTPLAHKREVGPARGLSEERSEASVSAQTESQAVEVPLARLGESFPLACMDESVERCFERVRQLLSEDRREQALQLLRDTLARHDVLPPDDLKGLLE